MDSSHGFPSFWGLRGVLGRQQGQRPPGSPMGAGSQANDRLFIKLIRVYKIEFCGQSCIWHILYSPCPRSWISQGVENAFLIPHMDNALLSAVHGASSKYCCVLILVTVTLILSLFPWAHGELGLTHKYKTLCSPFGRRELMVTVSSRHHLFSKRYFHPGVIYQM